MPCSIALPPPEDEAWASVQAWAKAVNKSNELTTDIRLHRFVPALEKTNATMQNPLHDFRVWLLPNASLSHPLRGGEKRMRAENLSHDNTKKNRVQGNK